MNHSRQHFVTFTYNFPLVNFHTTKQMSVFRLIYCKCWTEPQSVVTLLPPGTRDDCFLCFASCGWQLHEAAAVPAQVHSDIFVKVSISCLYVRLLNGESVSTSAFHSLSQPFSCWNNVVGLRPISNIWAFFFFLSDKFSVLFWKAPI